MPRAKAGISYVPTEKFIKAECPQKQMAIEDFLETEKGVKVHYSYDDNGKPALVLVHGMSMDKSSWHHQLEHFKDDYSILAYDQRGQGQSSKLRGKEHYSLKKFTDDLESITGHVGLDTFNLAGFSLGGTISMKYAQENPSKIEKLITINSPYGMDCVRLSFFLKHAVLQKVPFAQSAMGMFLDNQPIWEYRSRTETHMKCFRDMDQQSAIDTIEALKDEKHQGIDLSNIDHLLIYSSDDEIVRPNPLKNSNNIIIDGGHHYVIAQKYAEINQIMGDFLVK